MPKKWKREDITPEVLRQLLHLDEETGKLYWKERGPEWFKDSSLKIPLGARVKQWNTRYKGSEAFTAFAPDGNRGGIMGHTFRKPWVVYVLHNGIFPIGQVTNIDKNTQNCKPDNLVDVSISDIRHQRNTQAYCGATGFRGVSYSKGNYSAECREVKIGLYKTPIEAARAYDKAAFDKWGEHARLNFPEEYGLERSDDGMPEGYYATTT